MAVFKSEKFPSLRVSGAGKFEDGVLEVEGKAAEAVRRLVGNEAFGITEEKSKPATRSAKTAEDNTSGANDEKPTDSK